MIKTDTKEKDLIAEMTSVGACYGYGKNRRHPDASIFVLSNKNKIDIIDLEKTEILLNEAKEFVTNLAKEGKKIMYVGVKPEAAKAIIAGALSINMPYVAERWVGGTITNFSEIKKRIQKLKELREKKEKGELDVYTKKERLLIGKEMEKLDKYFGGLIDLEKMPDAIFVVDSKKENNAVLEANKYNIPIISISNTDCAIKNIEYPIVANDGSVSSIAFFVKEITEAYEEGLNKK